MTAARNPIDRQFEQACFGALSWPDFAGQLREAKLCVLVDRDYGSNHTGPIHPLLVSNETGRKFLAAFTSYERAWQWKDPKYQWAIELEAERVLNGTTTEMGVAVNPGSTTGIELAPAALARLRDGLLPEPAAIRIRSATLQPPRSPGPSH